MVTLLAESLRAVLAGWPDVRLAYLFGSAAAGRLRAGSDVDVGVRFGSRPTLDDISDLVSRFERAAGRRVDLVDLDTAPPLLQREIVMEGRLLLAVSDDERIDFETRALTRYMDTAHLRRVQRQYLRDWAEAYRAGTR